MVDDTNLSLHEKASLPALLARESYVAAIERAVSEHLGRSWTIAGATDMSDHACHPAAILSDGAYPVFAKFSDAPNGALKFEVELAGLSLLSDLVGILTPAPIGIAPAGGGCILMMDAVQPVPRIPHRWRQIGRTLARIHAV